MLWIYKGRGDSKNVACLTEQLVIVACRAVASALPCMSSLIDSFFQRHPASTRQTPTSNRDCRHDDCHRIRRKRQQDRRGRHLSSRSKQTSHHPCEPATHICFPARRRLPAQRHSNTSPSMGCEANQASCATSRSQD
jgi:hypothetical protein